MHAYMRNSGMHTYIHAHVYTYIYTRICIYIDTNIKNIHMQRHVEGTADCDKVGALAAFEAPPILGEQGILAVAEI